MIRVPAAAIVLLLWLAIAAASSHAATFAVLNTNETGDGSLQRAIDNANSNAGDDTIVFDLPGPGPHVITVRLPLPLLSSNIEMVNDRPTDELVTIRKSDAEESPEFCLLETTSGVKVTIAGLAITNGRISGAGAAGIANRNSDVTVRNCVISDHEGTGVSAYSEDASTTATLRVIHCTLSRNKGVIGGGLLSGGGFGGITLLVDNCTFEGNSSSNGGAVTNASFASITNCTFTNNTASGPYGGAVYNTTGSGPSANMTLRNCTFVGNSADSAGDSLYNDKGALNFGNNIFKAGGINGTIGNQTGEGSFLSTGHNISSDAAGGDSGSDPGGFLNGEGDRRNTAPLLGPLQDNGGPTFTHALLPGSPAINAADESKAPERDQRGYVRPDAPDVGAFEYRGTIPVTLANISTRVSVRKGENVLIGGFIVSGSQPKRLIVRALGPSLPVAGSLVDPQLQIFNSKGKLVASNDNWRTANNRQAIIDSGVAPDENAESAVLGNFNAGAYTAVVKGAGGGTGIGLVEVYDLDRTVGSKLVNISTRGLVRTGDEVMIGGFIIVGPDSQRLIIRGLGPSLPVAGKLANPRLDVYNSEGFKVGSNDNWRTGGQEPEIVGTNIPPPNDLESAAIGTLPPGGYTAIIKGVSGSTGVALVEVYALD